jgi:hypothetical protein
VEKPAPEPKQVEILTVAEFREMAKPKLKALPALPQEHVFMRELWGGVVDSQAWVHTPELAPGHLC